MFAFFAPGPIELCVIFAMVAVIIVPFWMIFSKAGFPGVLALLMVLPMINLFMIFFLAFAPWPALTKTEHPEEL